METKVSTIRLGSLKLKVGIKREKNQMRAAALKGSPRKKGDAVKPKFLIKGTLIKLMASIAKMLGEEKEKLPVVCIFGQDKLRLATPVEEDYEEKRLDCRCYPCNADLERVLAQDRPAVIITTGDISSFPEFSEAPFEIRKRWLHFDTLADPAVLGMEAYNCYLRNIFNDQVERGNPLVTVFTPTYKPGNKIYRPFLSLKEQTYTNWEWIVVDDSDDDGKTFKMLSGLAKKDHRIQVFKPWEHSGIIGKLKNWACRLGKGQILVELDHDDELTHYALDCVVKGFQQFPEAGFVYTDCAEIFEDGTSFTYREGWAFGYGSYSDVEYKGKLYKSANAPNINAKTIRHIASTPNHIRAWTKPFYDSIGGHNMELHVADDYEIMVRTFLKTRMVRVPKLCYLQHIGNTTQQVRNADIQRHIRSIRSHYDRMIHDRFLQLGCEDFIWDEKNGCSDFDVPNPGTASHLTLIAEG